MALITLSRSGKKDGFTVLNGCLLMPRVGAWVADLQVDHAEALSGKVELQIGGSTKLLGTVSRGALTKGIFVARVVAGGDGLRTTVKPRHYTRPSVRNVLEDVARDSGEAISPTADASVLGTVLNHWTTLARSGGLAIRALVEVLPTGTVWRHLPDGTMWVGVETWPDSGITDFVEVDDAPERATVELGLEQPILLPGTTIGGRRVDTVTHMFGVTGNITTTIAVAS